MNPRSVIHLVGVVLIIVSLFVLPSVAVSIAEDGDDLLGLLTGFGSALGFGSFMTFLTRRDESRDFSHRDGFVAVTACWLGAAVCGALPYVVSGYFPSFTDAFFESMSGFTTTGASVLGDIESLPRGLLLWRSTTQWMGGMGIVVFSLAVLPILGTGGMQLFKAEVPEITVDKLQPRIVDTAKALWMIYALLTAASACAYFLAGMDLYEAVNHAFTTLSTGGFSTRNASISGFDNPLIEWCAVLFMFLGGVNYTLHFFLLRGRPGRMFKNQEFRSYATITVASTALVLFSLHQHYPELGNRLRYSAFQVVSIMTTTGYATADFEQWSEFAQVLLVILMFFGGMIGSTGGGMKQVRVLLMLKQSYREMFQLIHPRAFTQLKLDGRSIPKEVLGGIWGFLFLFIFTCVLGTLAVAATGEDIVTASTTVISAMCNIGPALGSAGPAENYAAIHPFSKWILSLCMLVGRLEVYTVVILLVPAFWER